MGVDECMERVEGLGARSEEEQPSHLSRMAAGNLKAIEMRDEETNLETNLARRAAQLAAVRH